eukprot:TRINITY_DN6451_c0_g1_i5.p1 TRINITY_DN6451_c0_g1~~TRINITY_DN6451_c0_g1_i5.p1  ORF type:complete len:581 (-),score=138.87 TRINITY_DN6451_c0_g1_i5:203-1945(-)
MKANAEAEAEQEKLKEAEEERRTDKEQDTDRKQNETDLLSTVPVQPAIAEAERIGKEAAVPEPAPELRPDDGGRAEREAREQEAKRMRARQAEELRKKLEREQEEAAVRAMLEKARLEEQARLRNELVESTVPATSTNTNSTNSTSTNNTNGNDQLAGKPSTENLETTTTAAPTRKKRELPVVVIPPLKPVSHLQQSLQQQQQHEPVRGSFASSLTMRLTSPRGQNNSPTSSGSVSTVPVTGMLVRNLDTGEMVPIESLNSVIVSQSLYLKSSPDEDEDDNNAVESESKHKSDSEITTVSPRQNVSRGSSFTSEKGKETEGSPQSPREGREPLPSPRSSSSNNTSRVSSPRDGKHSPTTTTTTTTSPRGSSPSTSSSVATVPERYAHPQGALSPRTGNSPIDAFMKGMKSGTLLFNVIEGHDLAAYNMFGGSDVYVLVSTYKDGQVVNLDKRDAPSAAIGKTTVVNSSTVKDPYWNQDIALKVTTDMLQTKSGVHVQLYALKTFSSDRFLGELRLSWDDVNRYCNKAKQSFMLRPRDWATDEEKTDEDTKAKGLLTFKINFRDTDDYDFTGPIRNLGGWV